MLIGFALDSQEVTFIKQILQLSDRDYGLIVYYKPLFFFKNLIR